MSRPIRFARTAEEASALLDSKKICELAALLNHGVSCTIEERKYDGQEHAVLRLLFENKEQWALRMPINPNGKFSNDDIELPLEIMRSTTLLQQCLFKHGLMVPRVHWSCLRWSENPMGYPVALMDWIDGQPLDWEVIRHHPEAKAKVLAHLAEYIFDLSTLTESPEALEDLQALQPSITFKSATEWYYKDIDRRLLRSLRGTLKDVSPLELLSLRSSIPDYVVGHTEHIDCNRPVIFHDDIHPGNIVIDSQDSLRGIIDWDMISLIPLEAAIKLPTFLSKTTSMFPNPEWVVTDADRELYIQAFRRCELAKHPVGGTPLTDLLATSFRRAYFHEACHSLSVHRKWFQEHSRKPAHHLLQELEGFCSTNATKLEGLKDEVLKLRVAIEGAQKEDKRQQSHLREGNTAEVKRARNKLGSFMEVIEDQRRRLVYTK